MKTDNLDDLDYNELKECRKSLIKRLARTKVRLIELKVDEEGISALLANIDKEMEWRMSDDGREWRHDNGLD